MSGSGTADVTDLLALSDERDKWLSWLLNAERMAFARAHGYREGCERAYAEMDERWNRIARPVAHGGPKFTELEERRWGPLGREHFGDPRPGDFPGRRTAA